MKSLKVIYSKLKAIKGTGWNKNTALVSLFSMLFFLGTTLATAQVKTEVDTTTIRIGEQINYKINVQADSTALVVFPEGQT
ncbi:MAG: DUF4381 domain-containing protein, partial [Winogradskyella arenosi]